MKKLKSFFMIGTFVFVFGLFMVSIYTIVNNKSYSYVVENTGSELLFNNLVVDTNMDTVNYDEPTIINGNVNLDLSMDYNDYFNFIFDVSNTSELEYGLDNIIINSTSEDDINNYITFNLFYDDGTQVTRSSVIPPHTKRKIYAYIKYDKVINTTKLFKLNIDLKYNPTILK